MKRVSKPSSVRYLYKGPLGAICPACRALRGPMSFNMTTGAIMTVRCGCGWSLRYRIDAPNFRQVIK
jgi:RNase P subunit RPR2